MAIQFPGNLVVDCMSRFHIVVADRDCIVLHVGHKPAEEVLGLGVHIVIVIAGVVALQAVAGIYKHHVFRPVGGPDAVYIIIYRHQALPGAFLHISGIEPPAVHIVGGKQMQSVDTVLGAAGGQGKDG